MIRSSDLVLTCNSCSHEWWERVNLPMNMDAFVLRLKGLRCCPRCGHRDTMRAKLKIMLLTGEKRLEAINRLEALETTP